MAGLTKYICPKCGMDSYGTVAKKAHEALHVYMAASTSGGTRPSYVTGDVPMCDECDDGNVYVSDAALAVHKQRVHGTTKGTMFDPAHPPAKRRTIDICEGEHRWIVGQDTCVDCGWDHRMKVGLGDPGCVHTPAVDPFTANLCGKCGHATEIKPGNYVTATEFPDERHLARFKVTRDKWFVVDNDLAGGFALSAYDKPLSEQDVAEGEGGIADFCDGEIARHVGTLHNSWVDGVYGVAPPEESIKWILDLVVENGIASEPEDVPHVDNVYGWLIGRHARRPITLKMTTPVEVDRQLIEDAVSDEVRLHCTSDDIRRAVDSVMEILKEHYYDHG